MQKTIFSSFRKFVLQTSPQNWVVKRTREDFKWLTKSLKNEYPKKNIDKIAEGELNRKTIESFFNTLTNDPEILNCRHFLFFMKADEETFAQKSSKDFDWVKVMANKFSQNNKFQIKEMGLHLDENKVAFSPEESKKLNIYCDNVERIERKNQEAVLSIGSLTKKVIANFQALSDSVFDLGEAFRTLSEGYKTIEAITGSGLKMDFVRQSELYEKIQNCCLENA